jgi:hypothetical protein
MKEFTDVAGLLNWLIYGGGVILVSSWLLDKIPAFVQLASETKKLINGIVAIILALASYAALVYVPASYFAVVDPYLKVILGIVVLYGGQQVVHQVTK